MGVTVFFFYSYHLPCDWKEGCAAYPIRIVVETQWKISLAVVDTVHRPKGLAIPVRTQWMCTSPGE